jgi:hypothetical protein
MSPDAAGQGPVKLAKVHDGKLLQTNNVCGFLVCNPRNDTCQSLSKMDIICEYT